MSKKNSVYFIAGVAVAAVFLFFMGVLTGKGDNNSSSPQAPENYPQGYRIVSPEIPANPDFAGERIPVENFDVYERLDREFLSNTYWHSATLLAIKRANRWFPVIEPILKRNNIPDDFKYLCVAESNLDNVVSPAGAAGFWQFIKPTGIKYGLEINDLVDERYHVEKATEAACRYLQDSYNQFGNWITAAASYNVGQDGVVKQMVRQKANNYFNLSFNSETYRYLARIVAIKYILSNPADYGFDVSPDQMYQLYKYKEVTLNTSVDHFADFAAGQGINYNTLKIYNPWLLDNFLTNKTGKAYVIKIPEQGSIELIKE